VKQFAKGSGHIYVVQRCGSGANKVTEPSHIPNTHNLLVQLNVVLLAAIWPITIHMNVPRSLSLPPSLYFVLSLSLYLSLYEVVLSDSCLSV
jgi:hypothetical protein